MNVKLFIGWALLFLIPACNKSASTPPATLFVQLVLDSSALDQIRKTITPLINDSIKAELGLDAAYNFQFFSPKERQALTIYSIEDVPENAKPTILSTLEPIYTTCTNLLSHTITFAHQVDFFSGPFNINDELVIKVNDSDNSLSNLNREVKALLNLANEHYRQRHGKGLYAISKSERYSYVPHIGLGRVRSNSIKEHMKDSSGFDALFSRIQTRIKELAISVIKNVLTADNQTIMFNKVCIFDLKERICIKEAALNSDTAPQ